MFWKSHRPDGPNHSRQYMAAVFPRTAAQTEQARGSLERVARARGREVKTAIIPDARFVRAEDYHQKYYLRHAPSLMAEFATYSPAELVDSTVAARLNGYAAGRGTALMLETEVAKFGLGDAARAALATLVRRTSRA